MEERNVKLSLDKAREWYNQGGELKELALSAFTENEITTSSLPNTWEEFCNMYPIKEDKKKWFIDADSTSRYEYKGKRYINECKNILPSKQAAEQHLAYMQLHQLRDFYRQGWVPNWSDGHQNKSCIIFSEGNYHIDNYCLYIRFLSFQSKKIAEKFLNNFKDLIETAGDLI